MNNNLCQPLPITIISGFLGSGKTRFLSTIVKQKPFKNAAVIINEFAKTGLDHLLLESSNDQIFDLPDGCLCCGARSELINRMTSLIDERKAGNIDFDHLIIETSGVSDAQNLIGSLWREPAIRNACTVNNLITIVSAVDWLITQNDFEEVASQLAASDIILLSKCDLIPSQKRLEKTEVLKAAIALHNPTITPLVLPLTSRQIENLTTPNISSFATRLTPETPSHNVTQYKTITLSSPKPVTIETIEMFMDMVLTRHKNNLLRTKGLALIKDHENQPMVVQSVKSTNAPFHFLSHWSTPQKTAISFIFTGNCTQSITDLFQAAFDIPAIDQADKLALNTNPLAIPGIGKFTG